MNLTAHRTKVESSHRTAYPQFPLPGSQGLPRAGLIHIFRGQACGQGFDKPPKPLILQRFFLPPRLRAFMVQAAAAHHPARACPRHLAGYPHFLGASLWRSAGQVRQGLDCKGLSSTEAAGGKKRAVRCIQRALRHAQRYPHFLGASLWRST